MAIETEIHANIIKPSKTGNIPVINYNKDEGWTLYNKKSDKVAKDIRNLINKLGLSCAKLRTSLV